METTPAVPTRQATPQRRLPVGAEVRSDGVHFRVWAPRHARVDVVLDPSGEEAPLERDEAGYFAGVVAGAGSGTLYRYRLDGGEAFPDPASRFQPEGPHGPSQVIDPSAFGWTDGAWQGLELAGQALYELHVGTFTPEGTWAAALARLPALVALGVTAVEVMPVAEFPGQFGWGYDGVALFAPTRLYGAPDDFRRFIDGAHALGIGVLLDVVYNHLGPSGNYLRQFAEGYFTDRYQTDWGEALDFDGPAAGPVRELFLANAGYWIDEFHLDGLRLDATHAITDRSGDHIVTAIGRRVRESARGRGTLVFAENEPLHTSLVRPEREGGSGLDGIWNDDFHHIARVAATGRREGYYADYHGTAQELISAVKWGLVTRTHGVSPMRFVNFLENHDQIAHSARGLRLHALTSPGRHRALTAVLLLAPGTPMLFMGQEFSASSPFLYFADHEPEIALLVREGRAKFLAQFASLADPTAQRMLDDPAAPSTFERCRLDWAERERNVAALALHRDLLTLRRRDPVFAAQREGGVDGAVLADFAFVLRFFAQDGADRLMLVNLGRDLTLDHRAEQLLTAPTNRGWKLEWSSEDSRYGGSGTPEAASRGLASPGEAAVVLTPA